LRLKQTIDSQQQPVSAWRRTLSNLALYGGGGLLLLVPIVLAIYWVTIIGSRPMVRINVEGALHHVTPLQLRQLIEPQAQAGFFGIDVAALHDTLQALPWIASVRVRRIWPDQLEIHVQERVPMTRWGSQALLSITGEHFLPPPASMPDNLPWLDGPADSEQRVLDQYRQFVEVLASSGLSIYALTLDQRGAWRLLLDDELEVLLGRERMTRRLWRLAKVYSSVIKPKVAEIQRIDLRYSNGFALSWRSNDNKPNQ